MDVAAQSVSPAISTELREKLMGLVGRDYVFPATASETGSGIPLKLVIEPGNETELAGVLRLASDAGLSVIPRGGGTKLGWGNPPARADLVLSTARLNRVVEHPWADLTVTVEAGCTVQTLQEALARHGQRLALDPLWPEKATVGGVLSTNDSGALRLRFGSLRDLILGVTIALPDGTLARSGGKVVKNVAGYDLQKLVTGALGTLGVITQAVFRVHPRPHNTRSFSISVSRVEEVQSVILTIQDAKLAQAALQSRFGGDGPPNIDILFEGTEAGLDAQARHLRVLCEPAKISEASPTVWAARQGLWSASDSVGSSVAQGAVTQGYLEPKAGGSSGTFSFAIAKISILPASIARTMELVSRDARENQVGWKGLMYATGIGWLRLEGKPAPLRATLQTLREQLERAESSLVAVYVPAKMPAFDAWGAPGDSLPLMKAIKHQLDPTNTLNPGRFLSGI
jgi:glycolate oxidase FAD binding subunit